MNNPERLIDRRLVWSITFGFDESVTPSRMNCESLMDLESSSMYEDFDSLPKAT